MRRTQVKIQKIRFFKSIKNNAKITKIVNRIEGYYNADELAKAAVKYAGVNND